MTQPPSPSGVDEALDTDLGPSPNVEEHFKPVGTVYLLAVFVVMLILLWGSVYLILLSRGTTV